MRGRSDGGLPREGRGLGHRSVRHELDGRVMLGAAGRGHEDELVGQRQVLSRHQGGVRPEVRRHVGVLL
eukprot:5655724-Alexandrium_andersonii.AAC.1